MVGSATTGSTECCQKCGRPAARYAKPVPIVGSTHPPTTAEGWRELGPDEIVRDGDLFFGSDPEGSTLWPQVHKAIGNVGFRARGTLRNLRFFRSNRYRIEDLPLAEWRAKNGGNASMDQHVLAEHPGQRVTTIYRADGTVLLSSGHRPDESASWTAEQIVAAIGGELP